MHVADHAFPEGGSLVPESIKLLPLAVNQANLVTAQGQPNHIESCTLVQRLIPGENSTHMDKNPDWHEGYTSFYVRISQRAGDDNKLPRSAILYATGTYGWVVFAPIELYPQSLLLDIDRQKLP